MKQPKSVTVEKAKRAVADIGGLWAVFIIAAILLVLGGLKLVTWFVAGLLALSMIPVALVVVVLLKKGIIKSFAKAVLLFVGIGVAVTLFATQYPTPAKKYNIQPWVDPSKITQVEEEPADLVPPMKPEPQISTRVLAQYDHTVGDLRAGQEYNNIKIPSNIERCWFESGPGTFQSYYYDDKGNKVWFPLGANWMPTRDGGLDPIPGKSFPIKGGANGITGLVVHCTYWKEEVQPNPTYATDLARYVSDMNKYIAAQAQVKPAGGKSNTAAKPETQQEKWIRWMMWVIPISLGIAIIAWLVSKFTGRRRDQVEPSQEEAPWDTGPQDTGDDDTHDAGEPANERDKAAVRQMLDRWMKEGSRNDPD